MLKAKSISRWLNQTSPWLSKVPEVSFVFWAIKIMSTTIGETAADFLSFNLQFGLIVTTIIVGILLLLSLHFQFSKSRYVPVVYWATVTLISVFGTLITDNLTDHFGVPLAVSSAVFAVLLSAVFLTWHLKEKTLSIHSINTLNRELFYWLAILLTFALGTAVGDYVSESLHMGYSASGLIFGALILLITVTYFLFNGNAVICFWLAYILTRPLGASLGDYLTQPISNGGLSLASDYVNLVFFIAIVTLVSYLTYQQNKQKESTTL